MTETKQFINLRDFIEDAKRKIDDQIEDQAYIEDVAKWLVDSFSAGILVHTKPIQPVYEAHAQFAGVHWFLIAKKE